MRPKRTFMHVDNNGNSSDNPSFSLSLCLTHTHTHTHTHTPAYLLPAADGVERHLPSKQQQCPERPINQMKQIHDQITTAYFQIRFEAEKKSPACLKAGTFICRFGCFLLNHLCLLWKALQQPHGVYIEPLALPWHFSCSLWIIGGVCHQCDPVLAANAACHPVTRYPTEPNQILPTDLEFSLKGVLYKM